MKRKTKVSIGLIRGNQANIQIPKPDIERFDKLVAEGKLTKELVDVVELISRLDHQQNVKYGIDLERVIRMSPRGRQKVADGSKLEDPLPKGIFKKRLSGKVKT